MEDRPLVYWPLNESPNASCVVDRSGHNCVGHFRGNVRFMEGGPFSGNRRRSAEFSGNGYIQTDPLPQSDPATGFSVEASARCDGGPTPANAALAVLAYRDDRGNHELAGFTLYVSPMNFWGLQTGTGVPGRMGSGYRTGGCKRRVGPSRRNLPTDGRGRRKWRHQGRRKAVRPRQACRRGNTPICSQPASTAADCAGVTENPEADCFFVGQLAEVAIYDHPLSKDRIFAHWEASGFSDIAQQPSLQKEAASQPSDR